MTDIHNWVTTGTEFSGFRVVRCLGIVRGITVRSRSIFGTVGASIQTLFGGNISLYTELAEASRKEAYELMISHAAAMGANAILAMRYDATEVASGVTEVLAYGTAVVIESA
ncbi:MAG: heavy metal-binding domain-containing protein [Fimbriimonadaceae bacterium]